MDKETEILSREKSVSPHAGAWVLIAVAVLYSIAPLDFIPDVITPYGLVDDILVVAISIINLVQSYLKERHEALANKFRRAKLVMVQVSFFAIVAIAIIVLCTKIFA